MDQQRHSTRPTRTRRTARAFALVAVPLLLLTSCKLSDVTDPVVKPIEDILGLNDGEIATPRFELVNGITIQVVIRIDDLGSSLPITVNLRCAGGTEASATVTVKPSGDVGIGQTSFKPTWPAGTDCLVSQEIVQGVETVGAVLTWLDSNDVKTTFTNAA